MSGPLLTRIWQDSRGSGICRDCGDPLVWAEVMATGKRVPFNPPAVALRTSDLDGRTAEDVDRADNHWATCRAKNGGRG